MKVGDLVSYDDRLARIVELPRKAAGQRFAVAVVRFTKPKRKGGQRETITVVRKELSPVEGGKRDWEQDRLRGIGMVMAGGRRRVGDTQAVYRRHRSFKKR